MTIRGKEEQNKAPPPPQRRQETLGRTRVPRQESNESTALILKNTPSADNGITTIHYSQESPANCAIVSGSLTGVGCLTISTLASAFPAWLLASWLTNDSKLQGILFCAFLVAAFFCEAVPSAITGYGVYKLLQCCCNSDDSEEPSSHLSPF